MLNTLDTKSNTLDTKIEYLEYLGYKVKVFEFVEYLGLLRNIPRYSDYE